MREISRDLGVLVAGSQGGSAPWRRSALQREPTSVPEHHGRRVADVTARGARGRRALGGSQGRLGREYRLIRQYAIYVAPEYVLTRRHGRRRMGASSARTSGSTGGPRRLSGRRAAHDLVHGIARRGEVALHLLDVLAAGRLQRHLHLGLAQARPRERAVVEDVQHVGSHLGDQRGEPGELPGPVAEHHGETDQAPVLDEPALDDAGERFTSMLPPVSTRATVLPASASFLLTQRGERRRARALHHRLLDLEQQEDGVGDLLLVTVTTSSMQR